MSVTTYCAWTDVTDRLSGTGASLRTDDDIAAADAVLERASVFVNRYLLRFYSVAALAASAEVRHLTADVATYYASTRRGNPAPKSVQDQYQAAVEELTALRGGGVALADAPQIKASAPVLSNQRVRQYPVSEVKTVTGKSTGTPAGYPQHTDTFDNLDYTI